MNDFGLDLDVSPHINLRYFSKNHDVLLFSSPKLRFLIKRNLENATKTPTNNYDTSHVTMTYSALCSLLILGDDLSRVSKNSIVDSILSLQVDNGWYVL